jgi:hypothetical protein
MMSIHELLEDKQYKEFFLKQPEMPSVIRQNPHLRPWRVYIQREADGPWAKKDLRTYTEAFQLFKHYRPDIHDAAICSRSIGFAPPHRLVRIKGQYREIVHKGKKTTVQVTKLVVWKPKLPPEEGSHTWCTYCRRPTIFRYFSKHHAFTGSELQISQEYLRCTICGIREDGMPRLIRGAR